jgi:alanine dehydrogenase
VNDLLYLSRTEVARLLPGLTEQIDVVEETYRALAAGRVELPPKPGVHPRRDSFLHAMPAYLRDDDVVALKWVAGYPANKERGLPYITGLIVLNDPDTGLPLAIMDGAEITAARVKPLLSSPGNNSSTSLRDSKPPMGMRLSGS